MEPEQQALEMLRRFQTELERRTEIAEATTARTEVTLREVRNLKLQMFEMQTALHNVRQAAGLADT